MALTAITTYSVAVTGTDANGSTVNQQIGPPPLVNTSLTQIGAITQPLTTGSNTVTFAPGGFKTCTVTPPTGNAVAITLGGASGLAVNPALPFSFGISGASCVLYLGAGSIAVTLAYG